MIIDPTVTFAKFQADLGNAFSNMGRVIADFFDDMFSKESIMKMLQGMLGEDSKMFKGMYPNCNFAIHHNDFNHELILLVLIDICLSKTLFGIFSRVPLSNAPLPLLLVFPINLLHMFIQNPKEI